MSATFPLNKWMHSYPHMKKNGEAIWDRWADWYQRIFLFKKCTLWDEKNYIRIYWICILIKLYEKKKRRGNILVIIIIIVCRRHRRCHDSAPVQKSNFHFEGYKKTSPHSKIFYPETGDSQVLLNVSLEGNLMSLKKNLWKASTR